MQREAPSLRFDVRDAKRGVAQAAPRLTLNSQLSTLNSSSAFRTGFTLLELLVVIAIIGVLAALSVPTLNSFKLNITATAERQLLDDLARARQLAISQRTTNYMVFVPTNFWDLTTQPAFNALSPSNKIKAARLVDKQLIGYAFVTLRSLGDQPGRPTKRYVSEWKTLPEGSFIHPGKFLQVAPPTWVLGLTTNSGGTAVAAYNITNFFWTTSVPFPDETAEPLNGHYVALPYIAFDQMGRLVTGQDEFIPLGKGAVSFSRDPNTKTVLQAVPTVQEMPAGNATNSFNLVWVDRQTGRARTEHQSIQ